MEIFKKIWRRLHPKCPKCDTGRLWHLGAEMIGVADIEVWICDECGERFV